MLPERHLSESFAESMIMAQASLGRILVVDDERDIAESLQSNLSQHGYDVTATTSAKHALQLIAKDTFALLLSDMVMPEMNGLQLLQESRSEERRVGKECRL